MVKLSPDRVSEIVKAGNGLPFKAGKMLMKNMVIIPETKKQLWIQFCEEAKIYMKK